MHERDLLSRFFTSEIEVGDAVAVGESFVVPLVRTTHIRVPYLPLAGTWQKPVGIVVIDENGERELLPIQDPVRKAQLNILAWSFLGVLVLWRLIRRSGS